MEKMNILMSYNYTSLRWMCTAFFLTLLLIQGGEAKGGSPFSLAITQDGIRVRGMVTASDGTPLSGVNIRIKGSNRVVNTNANGVFTMQAPARSTLVVTYLGFKSQEVRVDNRRQLQIVLEEETTMLDDVVVVGYGTMQKSDLTGSVYDLRYRKQPAADRDRWPADRV